MSTPAPTIEPKPPALDGAAAGQWQPVPWLPGTWAWWDGSRYTVRAFKTADGWAYVAMPVALPRQPRPLVIAAVVLGAMLFVLGMLAFSQQNVSISDSDLYGTSGSDLYGTSGSDLYGTSGSDVFPSAPAAAVKAVADAGIQCNWLSAGAVSSMCELSSQPGDTLMVTVTDRWTGGRCWVGTSDFTVPDATVQTVANSDASWVLWFGVASPRPGVERIALLQKIAQTDPALVVDTACTA